MKPAATDRLIALQFLAVVLPIGLLLLLQLIADTRRAMTLAESSPLRTLAQEVRANYRTFTNGAADAVDTGSLGTLSVKALRDAADGLQALAARGGGATLGEAPRTVRALAEAIPRGATLEALLPLREQIARGDALTESIYQEYRRRDDAVVRDAIESAMLQRGQVMAAFLATTVLSAFFVTLARRRLRERIEADAAIERERRAELEAISLRFTMATRAARAGVYELHANGEGLWWSDSMYALYGCEPGAAPPALAEWLDLIHPEDREPALAAINGAIRERTQLSRRNRVVTRDGREVHVESIAAAVAEAGGRSVRLVGIDLDVTERVEAERREADLQRQLQTASRQAGMAEVATNVLHNVGNVLNSVNVSASLVAETIRKPRAASLTKVVTLLQDHRANLASFITENERGRHLLPYLSQLAEHIVTERDSSLQEIERLQKNIAHIKEVVAMQQSYAKRAGVTELLAVQVLVEDALNMTTDEFARHGITLVRDFGQVPSIEVDRHRVLQVLVNLLRNAKAACDATGRGDKRVTVQLAARERGAAIAIADNGVGIPAENMTRIFSHGFTTKSEGHGFGLHGAALAARELGGALHVHSDGAGLGATFTLELPPKPPGATHGT